jgi:hypothetical protein
LTQLKSTLAKTVTVAAMAGGLLMAGATAASADVVCNRFHECWRVPSHYNYPVEVGGVWHTDHWYKAHAHDPAFIWRADRGDHGYYRNGVWIAF